MKNKKVNLIIEFRTKWGEEVVVSGNHKVLGNYLEYSPLSTKDGYTWSTEFEFGPDVHTISYQYAIRKDGVITTTEACRDIHNLNLLNGENILVKDSWTSSNKSFILNKNIFKEVWIHSMIEDSSSTIEQGLLLEGIINNINPDEELAICGNTEQLGNWNTDRALIINQNSFPKTKVLLETNNITFPLEYKYLVFDKATRMVKKWEDNNNRILRSLPVDKFNHIKIEEGEININRESWRGAGVTIPIFSLRTKMSFGIGEFLDLIPLVNWCKKTNLKIIQILPINDTISTHDWPDSYPYKCTSVFALNPIYLNLEEMGIAQTKYSKEYFELKSTLNRERHIDYPTVQKSKLKYINELYNLFGSKIIESKECIQFFNDNKSWLLPYATYLHLRNVYKSNNIKLWKEHQTYSTDKAQKLLDKNKSFFNRIFYTQYHLHKQLKKASDYTNKQGIALKGDLPIGISKQSVDAWLFPNLFNLSNQAGAPPDAFAEQGQNWGFPTYNWLEMEREDFAWWKNRLLNMSQFYKAFRIDHILGFFRIWSIPESATYGTLGQYDPALPYSKEEIEGYGLLFDRNKMTEPHITKQMLLNLFTDTEFNSILSAYFLSNTEDTYSFKEEYDSQQKIMQSQSIDQEVKDKLIYLHSNVLFLVDLKEQLLYHPRIDAQKTQYYQQELSDSEKRAFDHLYQNFFYHRNNELWEKEAYKKLPALTTASSMLVCGEDLGMIPNSVPAVMRNLAILSLEVARIPKLLGEEIGNSYRYAYDSISTFSTHDMGTIRGWWNDNLEQRKAISNYPDLDLTKSDIPLEKDIEAIITRELSANSILCIEAIQDWLALSNKYHVSSAADEQINIPADSNHQWKYRIPCYIEDLIDDTSFNRKISSLIHNTKRN